MALDKFTGIDQDISDEAIVALHAVPTKDATTDSNMRDVVGKKDDTATATVATTKSIVAYIKGILNELAKVPKSDGTSSWNATALAAIEAECVDAIDTSTVSATPTANSLATFIVTGGTARGTALPASTSLYDTIKGSDSTTNRQAGRMQSVTTTIDLNQAAATYDLLTGTTQAVTLEGFVIRMPDAAGGGALTSISVQTDCSTAQTIISSTDGAVANLTAEAQLAWTGVCLIPTGTKIQLTIGGGAHGSTYTCTVVALYRAVTSGGYLA